MLVLLTIISSSIPAAQLSMPAPAAAVVCAACHGDHGQSPKDDWPNLSGQHAAYLFKQLQDFRSGTKRNSSIMQPMITSLSQQTLLDLANFYSQQPQDPAEENASNARGQELYIHGDRLKQIPACTACHGPNGQGNALAGFPVISRQKKIYTKIQLLAFKQKTRSNDLRGIMQDIAANMTTEDMDAVSDYLAGMKFINEAHP